MGGKLFVEKENILIIDPDENSRYLLSLIIERMGYRFKVVEDLEKGWKELKNGSFSLIITDVPLLEAKQVLEIQELQPDISFIFSGDSVEIFKDHIKPGISDFLSKPFAMEEAEFRLKRIIVDRGTRRRYEDAERELQVARE